MARSMASITAPAGDGRPIGRLFVVRLRTSRAPTA